MAIAQALLVINLLLPSLGAAQEKVRFPIGESSKAVGYGPFGWDRNAELSLDGVRTMIKIVAEINNQKEPFPSPSKYIDQSYLKQALGEIERSKK
jgi:hypothetical protein